MNTFKHFFNHNNKVLLEFFNSIDGAVSHIDHLEENILNYGEKGVVDIITQVEAAANYFVKDTGYKISTKFDGAPAIVAGLDPSGLFFVASKSAFNKNPKINYTKEDIINNHGHAPGLVEKLSHAFDYLPRLNMKGIYQMDYMFDSELKQIETPSKINGIANNNTFITFKPNTIKYAVPQGSSELAKIQKAAIGVAIHIQYQVVDGILKVKKYTSSPSEFTNTDEVYLFNVLIGQQKGKIDNLSNKILADITKYKENALKLIKKIDFVKLNPYTSYIKAYINKEIRDGAFLHNTGVSADEFIRYILEKYQKEVDALKSEKGKAAKQEQMNTVAKDTKALRGSIKNIFEITKITAVLKNSLIKLFNQITKNENLGFYTVNQDGSWSETEQEGYAISWMDGDEVGITKAVDREEFSRKNFASGKPGA